MEQGDICPAGRVPVHGTDDAAVDLYPHDLAGRSCKRNRQGRQPDTDLDDDVIGADLPGTDDGLGGMAVDQEVLTEFFFGARWCSCSADLVLP